MGARIDAIMEVELGLIMLGRQDGCKVRLV